MTIYRQSALHIVLAKGILRSNNKFLVNVLCNAFFSGRLQQSRITFIGKFALRTMDIFYIPRLTVLCFCENRQYLGNKLHRLNYLVIAKSAVISQARGHARILRELTRAPLIWDYDCDNRAVKTTKQIYRAERLTACTLHILHIMDGSTNCLTVHFISKLII